MRVSLSSGERIFPICLGTWQMGGLSWAPQRYEEWQTIIRAALEFGVNMIDVSPSYGNGHAQAIIGRVLERCEAQPFLMLKIGLIEDGTYRGAWSSASLARALDQSLVRLRRASVDCIALHSPPLEILKARHPWRLLHKFRSEGKARYVGVSLEADPVGVNIAIAEGVDIIQPRFNLLYRECAEVVARASQMGVTVIANAALAHGYLSGRYSSFDDIDPLDYPRGRASKPPEVIEEYIRRCGILGSLAESVGMTLPEFSLGYVLGTPGIAGAVVGLRSLDELSSAVAFAETQLDVETRGRLEDLYCLGYWPRN